MQMHKMSILAGALSALALASAPAAAQISIGGGGISIGGISIGGGGSGGGAVSVSIGGGGSGSGGAGVSASVSTGSTGNVSASGNVSVGGIAPTVDGNTIDLNADAALTDDVGIVAVLDVNGDGVLDVLDDANGDGVLSALDLDGDVDIDAVVSLGDTTSAAADVSLGLDGLAVDRAIAGDIDANVALNVGLPDTGIGTDEIGLGGVPGIEIDIGLTPVGNPPEEGNPGNSGNSGDPGQLVGLSPVQLGTALDGLDRREVRKLKVTCRDVLRAPARFKTETVAVCRVIASL